MKRVLIATGGGDCPGLNAVIRAVVRRASQEKGWEVIGGIQSFDGVLSEPPELRILDDQAVSGMGGLSSALPIRAVPLRGQ